MTKEEAIKELEEEWDEFLDGTGLKYKTEEAFQKEVENNPDLKKVVEAHYMSIKALKQEPCEDAISKQVVLSKIKEVCFSEEWLQFRVNNGSCGVYGFLLNYIEEL